VKYINGKMKDINIAYIGGGSREWAWKLMTDLALEESLEGQVKLYDPAVSFAEDNAKIGNGFSKRSDAKSKWKYSVVINLEDALKDADFVIISILPGTFKEMTSDVHTPEKYGIYQPVGDTVGPGGLMRALRAITIYIGFAEAIKKICPDAWIINYTNPMTICTRILYKIFPEIKAFGCCHEVFHTQNLLRRIIENTLEIENLTRDDIKINVLGINHFTWISSASYKNINLFHLYKDFIIKHSEKGFSTPEEDKEDIVFRSKNLVKFDLFQKFGLIAAAGDRHLAEFMPGKSYLKDPETVARWKFMLTSVTEYRMKKSESHAIYRKKVIAGEEKLELKPSGEEGVRMIKALCGLTDFISNVNIPNQGQFQSAPRDAVVETNAHFSYNSIKPVHAGDLPSSIKSMVIRHIYNQETVINAGVLKDKELAFLAFLNDPLMTISSDDAKSLFNEMLSNIKEYLPGWKI